MWGEVDGKHELTPFFIYKLRRNSVWRCVKYIFGYCNGTPDWSKEPYNFRVIEKGINPDGDMRSGECKLTPPDCGKFVSNTQAYAKAINELAARISKKIK
jgi:hypothetical protein